LRKSLLMLVLALFILTSAPAMAGGEKADIKPVGSLNFTDKTVYFLDHTSDPKEGNWITLGCPDEGRRIQLPSPLKLTYNGPKYKEYGGASGTLNKEEGESYTIKYPSTSSYTSHPVYLSGEKVTMSFHGDSRLKWKYVDVYLFRVNSGSARELFDALNAGNIGSLDSLFEESVGEEYKKYPNLKLDGQGDLSDRDLGSLEAGQYFIVMVQQNDESLTVFSSTAFVVTEYELCVSSCPSIIKGDDLDITVTLKKAPYESGCTYGAVLIKEQAYKANIEVNSDGTKDGTSVIVNDLDIIEEFDINSSNYRSKLTKNELQTEIQTLIGEGNGAIAIGNAGDNRLSLTTFDLPVGCYYLLVGAYSPEKGLVGLNQLDLEIKSKGSSKKDNKKEFSESKKNVKTKHSCQRFVSNGKGVKFEFKDATNPVGYIKFNSKKTAGSITAIVEELKGRSSLASADPQGIVYKHLNIRIGDNNFANSKNIENAVVGFKVGKEWMDENHINKDTIALQHYNGDQWESLKTKEVDEDGKYIYFEAETPSFSPYAITASKNILEIEEKTEGDNSQFVSGGNQQDNSESVMESDMFPKENGNSILRIASFFIGFLVIIAIGTIIKKKIAGQEDEDEDLEE